MAVRRGSLTGTVLKCSIRGDPPLNVQWRKDSNPLDATQSRIVTRAQPTTTTSGSSFNNPTSLTSECVRHQRRRVNDGVFLQVQNGPHPPLDVRVASTAGRRIQLEWKPPAADGGNAIQEFVIFYQSPSIKF